MKRLFVIVLTTILLSPYHTSHGEPHRVTTAKLQLKTLQVALRLYRLTVGECPCEKLGLNALLEPQSDVNWQGPYISSVHQLVDPWGNRFRYRRTGSHQCHVATFGRDNLPGGKNEDEDLSVEVDFN